MPGVIGSYLGHTPDGHESVADVLRDPRPMAFRGRAEEIVVPPDDVASGLGVDLFLERRRSGQVGEQDGHGLAGRALRGGP